jgi:hypothetical protein
MECPEGSFCFRKESFGIWLILITIILFYFYYKMSRKVSKTNIYKEKIIELENTLKELNNKLSNISSTKKREEIVKDINNLEEQRELYYRRIRDPLEVPYKTYEFTKGVQSNVDKYTPKQLINIPTRGMPTDFQPIGVLTNIDTKKEPNILQLFGRPLWIGSNKWQYYTSSDNYQSIKIQVVSKRRECLSDLGCEELYTGDTVFIPSYGMNFRVDLYRFDKPQYVPYFV